MGCSQSVHPMKILYCIIVELDGSWKVFVNNQHVERNVTPIFSAIPEHLNHAAVMQLISVMDSANVCCGYPQSKYIEMADTSVAGGRLHGISEGVGGECTLTGRYHRH